MKKFALLCCATAVLFAQTPNQTVTVGSPEIKSRQGTNANQARQNAPQTAQQATQAQQAQQNSVPLSSENVHIVLAQLAGSTNANLPQRLDFVTIFDRAVSKDKVLKYYYILNDDEDFVLSKFKKDRKDKFLDDIRANVKNSVCSSDLSKNLLEVGAVFSYHFELRNGTKYFNFKIDKSSCK